MPASAVHLTHTFQPPAGYKLKRKRRWPWVVLVVLILMVIGSAIAGTASKEDAAANGSADNATAAPAAGPLAVGSTDTTSGFEVTLLQYVDNWTSSNQFEAPADGKRFVAVELNLVNTRPEVQTFSTLLGLEVIDSLGQRWPAGIYGTELPSVGGDIAPGTNIRGWQVFEVPADATGMRLVVKGSLTASGTEFQL